MNLSNKHFVELFPDLAKLSREFVAEEAAAAAAKKASSSHSSSSFTTAEGAARRQLERNNAGGGDGGPAGGGGIFQGAATNLLVMCGFLAFSFVVRHVLNTIAATGGPNNAAAGPDLEE